MAWGQGGSGRPGQGTGRFEQWRAGWRVALRMARRDVRRHRGRSILITVMVGLPVLLLVAGSTLWFSEDLDTEERLPLQVGQSQGYLVGPRPQALTQLLDPNTFYGNGSDHAPAAKPVPGFGPGTEAAALGELVGGRLHPMTSIRGTARVDGHRFTVTVVGADATDGGGVLSPRASLETGRWPTGPDEALVTALGVAAGLPATGTFELTTDDGKGGQTTRTVTLVGTGQGFSSWSPSQVTPAELVMTPMSPDLAETQWLVERNSPITWPEIEQLNTYGVGAYSRYVVQHPETMQVPDGMGLLSSGSISALYGVGGASLGLLLLTTLLAGPAFAVSAARQRRTLALASSNGATTAQLRRSVLAQALVLGALSSLVGAAIGLAAGLAAVVLIGRLRPNHFFGPLEVPWSAMALVTAAGVLSSVVAALIPSRGLGRLDIVSVMRGQSVSPRLRKRVPVVGAVLAGVGVAAVSLASFQTADVYFFVFLGGVLLLVIGALLVVPLVLALGGRRAHRLPLAARMAAREAGRLRGRATPTVAAIMAGAAVLTTVCIALQGDTLRKAKEYQPVLADGQAMVYPPGGPDPTAAMAETTAAIRRADPTVRTLGLIGLGFEDVPANRLAAPRAGCTPREVIVEDDDMAAVEGREVTRGDPPPKCATVSTSGSSSGSQLIAADLDELTTMLDLTPEQRAGLAQGAVAILDPDFARALPHQSRWGSAPLAIEQMRPVDLDVVDGRATFFRYTLTPGPDGRPTIQDHDGTDVVTLPVVHLGHDQWVRIVNGGSGGPGGIITTHTASRLGLQQFPNYIVLRGNGPITGEQEQRIFDAVGAVAGEVPMHVERGFQRDDGLIIALVIGVIALIILVATLIATALGQAEAAPLLGTLAAVGATRRTRRAMAGAQATYLGLLGAVLGVLVGVAPGIALSRIMTARYTDQGMDVSTVVIDVPWLQILLPVVLVPLVAGALAWLSVRRAPVVTRRAT
ncbi:MAG: FtsX-like permease family protein [Intrasporangium sp.]|uniref:FtsX-like permease family protein n=1 Tax=Intrasporangium sp. TaxID=1925024 RepID=UPI003F7D261A